MAGPALNPDPLHERLPGRCYRVGGCVRDELLGVPAGDRDWVVVGATPQDMLDAGFRPVGRDFPVFLHPHTHDEYALARTERKSGPGYRGFAVHTSPRVTLEEDLARRDLTINAMARDEQGQLIDPFGGARDLAAGVLRHVSDAFDEDPVRLLRVARFAARWPDFRLAPETLELLRRMVGSGEVDALVPERVWQELARGLMERRPSRMVQVLTDCGAAGRILPGVTADAPRLAGLDRSAALGSALPVRCAVLAHGVPGLWQRLHAPREPQDLADLLERSGAAIAIGPGAAQDTLALLERCDALRRPQRFEHLLQAAACVSSADPEWAPARRWHAALERLAAIDSAAISREAAGQGLAGPAVGRRIRDAQLAALGAAA